MARVFISHSSRDNAEAARIKTWLTEQGFDAPFLDFDKHQGIAPGANWEQTLYREIDLSDAVIIIQTPNWLDSKWCFAEFTQARALGKPVFPVIHTPTGETLIAEDIQALDLTRDVEGGLARLSRELTSIALDAQSGFAWEAARPPYPGLLAFQEEDAAVYFGRDDDIRRLIERLNARRIQGGARIIALLGASGSGKSSLMRAGVTPRLRRAGRNWIVLPAMRPQTRPLDELARCLAIASDRGRDWRRFRETLQEPDLVTALHDLACDLRMQHGANEAQILLPVDQAEELFGASDPEQARQFLAALSALESLPDTPLTALLAMRSDYLGALQAAEHLAARFEEFSLGPMPRARIPQIIEGPARVAGLGLDEALVHQAAADAETEDALPLLAFALRELYDSAADDNHLSLDEYAALGDAALGLTPLENAVRRAADTVLREAQPSEADLTALREAFIPAMVRINDKGEYVRQPASWADLPARAHPLLERLARARLLIIRQDEDAKIVEVTHEALLRKWPRLRGWLDDAREFLAGRQQLELDRLDWERAADADKRSALLAGLKLNRARDWLTDRPTQLSAEDRGFIQASMAQAEAYEKRRARTRKTQVATLFAGTVFAVLAAFAGYLFVSEQREAAQRLDEQIDLVWADLATSSLRQQSLQAQHRRAAQDILATGAVNEDTFFDLEYALYEAEIAAQNANVDNFDCRTFLNTGFRAIYCNIRNVLSLQKIESLAGLNVYLPGSPHGDDFNFDDQRNFGRYDPAFLDFVDEKLVPDGPNDPRVNFASQAAYDVQIGPIVRALFHTHHVLFSSEAAFACHLERIAEYRGNGPLQVPHVQWDLNFQAEIFSFDRVLQDYDRLLRAPDIDRIEMHFFWFEWLSDYLAAEKLDDIDLANTAANFWVRRYINGNDARVFDLVVDMLEAFEPEVLRAAQSWC